MTNVRLSRNRKGGVVGLVMVNGKAEVGALRQYGGQTVNGGEQESRLKWQPMDLVQQAIERHGEHIAVACSFGKDSIDVLKMALEINPNIVVIYENTGVAFVETHRFKKRMADEWKLNLYETSKLKTYWDCVELYGLPTMRKGGGNGRNAPRCCEFLKEKPAEILQKELGINAVITGLQSCESQARKKIAMRYDNKKAPYMEREFGNETIEFCAQRWYTRNTDTWSYHPIMHEPTFNVWKRALDDSTPINTVYTKWDIYGNIYDNPNITLMKKGTLRLDGNPALYDRCGCLTCTAYLNWEKKLSVSHPKLYRKLKGIQCPEQTSIFEVANSSPPFEASSRQGVGPAQKPDTVGLGSVKGMHCQSDKHPSDCCDPTSKATVRAVRDNQLDRVTYGGGNEKC